MLNKFLAGLALACSLAFSPLAYANEVPPPPHIAESIQMQEQMLQKVVVISTYTPDGKPGGKGSGTVIHSSKEHGTYILTNHHVVARALKAMAESDPGSQPPTITATNYLYSDHSVYSGTLEHIVEVVAYHEEKDLALLKLKNKDYVTTDVARVAPEGRKLYIAERVWAVGGGLGRPPYITEGIVGFIGHNIQGYPYITSSAPIIFGNSGGALFHKDPEGNYELVGVPSRTTILGFFTYIPQIGYAIQMSTIRAFLIQNNYQHIL